MRIKVENLDWKKVNGQVPAVIQDAVTKQVLMLGYMTPEALEKTLDSGLVTFFSRTRQELWTKGETSGNSLKLVSLYVDCDQDTLLILVNPVGATCHTGSISCFEGDEAASVAVLSSLSSTIRQRNAERPEGSYTTTLFESGKSRISQKVGEEGVELALAHMEGNKKNILNEAADLFFHTLVLLENSGVSLNDVCDVLKERQK